MNKSNLLNQTTFKFIAVLSMLIDHIGLVFFSEIIIFRIIGRFAFPIFAFLIARGYSKTKNKIKYLLRIFLFGVISIYPYYLIFKTLNPNILFTFALSILLMLTFEIINKSSFKLAKLDKFFRAITIFAVITIFVIVSELLCFEYGFLGVLLPFIFWELKENNSEKYIIFIALTFLYCIFCLVQGYLSCAYIQCYSLLAIPLIALTGSNQGKKTFKWFFYIFYPLHLTLLYLLTLIV
ncbi:MAG: TraX family protein [Clostridia bacterium]